ncbi:hypothetical protein CROQUDRAFT_659714 [Cronartium quercuum f. sp. fusiforme G11]|uniref:Prephenate dehydratase domain-containing protein n=1 Tax=Cronartium quercuum f. sp. fusiforme G11 TaxID=708437 RepID=A0A9P6TA09_9BASI|nr:hypothetical protein CROQUDRAFT_659714 [Cronartium quercuum f. sp. fusiforme G11]
MAVPLSEHQNSSAEVENNLGPHHFRTVAFLGPVGTYTHEACLHKFERPEFILKPYPDIRTAVYSLLSNDDRHDSCRSTNSLAPTAWVAVVPLKNSTAGPVIETEEVLSEPEVARKIVRSKDEIVLKIEHCLVGRKEDLNDNSSFAKDMYDVVASHTQALQQCNGYLTQHYPNIRRQETSSTSQAASMAANDLSGKTLAICSPICASIFDSLKVLDYSIQDSGIDNQTTFIILQRKN